MSASLAGVVQRSRYVETLDAAWAAHLAPRAADAPTVVSLFAGCGGSSLGYSMGGFREILAVEWDANAVETFRLSFPDVPVYPGDIADLSVEAALDLAGVEPGRLDVLDGSPPCQGFSVAGRQVIDDPRNQLFRQYVRLLVGFRPRVFVMENVAGLVGGKLRLVFVAILRALRMAGYRVSVRVLNAMYFGVPQSRPRLMFVGVRDDLNVEPTHPGPLAGIVSARAALDGVAMDEDERATLLDAGARYATYRHWHHVPVGRNPYWLGTGAHFTAKKVHPDRPSFTVSKMDAVISAAGLMHWRERRRFTVAEYKRLASFPDQFRFVGSWPDAVARIGNSVPPLLMRAIAEHIRAELL